MVDQQLRELEPVIARKAQYWRKKGVSRHIDVDDLIQEGRIAVADALEKFDPAVAQLRTFAGTVLDRRFGNLLRGALGWKRRPHICERNAAGVKVWIACPTLSIDAPGVFLKGAESEDFTTTIGESIQSEGDEPDRLYEARELHRLYSLVFAAVRARLTPTEARVLDAYLNPSPAMLIAWRNLGNGTEWRTDNAQIAFFLGVTLSTVDHALRRVRRLAATELRARVGDL